MKRITKLVLPVAGRGKRLLPLTRHIPKNLIKVNGRPLIEYVLEEAVLSGIKEVILIVNPSGRGKFQEYLRVHGKKFPELGFHVREQATPGGNGHAIIQAYDLLRGEAFAVRFCDDIIIEKPPVLQSLIRIYESQRSPVLLLERVPKKIVSRFGVVGIKKVKTYAAKNNRWGGNIYEVTEIVEKPLAKEAPSNLTIVGGYIITPSILRNLKSVSDTLPMVADDALPLAVALQIELIIKGRVYGWEFPGRRLDCGTLEKLKKAEEILKIANR
ncbi:MAG: NTP transferase domain-containing protein [Patescibacteria group bacterium]|nr:NTP transferase domain-containing protein [Patescibacteria group bacterium]MDE2015076.1 NTP transferase domain-containing protein [Patescibacteria group bacterium]MDE2226504.1 NTP transferase domain-containing protein [Patescibacteria group bacterium]